MGGIGGAAPQSQNDVFLKSASRQTQKLRLLAQQEAHPPFQIGCDAEAMLQALTRALGPQGWLRSQISSPWCPRERGPQAQFLFIFTGECQQITMVQNQNSVSLLPNIRAAQTIAEALLGCFIDTAFLCPHLASPQESGTCWTASQLLFGEEVRRSPPPSPRPSAPRGTPAAQGDAVPFVCLPAVKTTGVLHEEARALFYVTSGPSACRTP